MKARMGKFISIATKMHELLSTCGEVLHCSTGSPNIACDSLISVLHSLC